jgi:hypothetical protein
MFDEEREQNSKVFQILPERLSNNPVLTEIELQVSKKAESRRATSPPP